MLRITQRDEWLLVEGRIAGPWVLELERAVERCVTRLASPALDLSGVSYVDAAGAVLLRSLVDRRLPIRSSSAFVNAILEEKKS